MPWLEGTVALEAPLGPDGAAELGAALAQVHVPAPDGAPNNEWRGFPLAHRTAKFDARLALLDGRGEFAVDADAVKDAVASADPRPFMTWCHLDIHGNNVLSRDGHLGGLLDWGDSGAGDPATDLGQARYLLGTELFTTCAEAYVAAGGPAEPDAPRVLAEALVYSVMMATFDAGPYRASGWRALVDLGVATPL